MPSYEQTVTTGLTANAGANLGAASDSDLAITAQPVSLSVLTGAAATFSVTATAMDPIAYQWRRDGQPIAGATASTYTIASASLTDAAAYSVDVVSGNTILPSDKAILSVANAGTISVPPAGATITAGSDTTLSVVATGTALTYQWLFDAQVILGANAATYAVTNAGVKDSGIYTVEVSDATGVVAVESAMLSVTFDARLTNLSVRGFVGSGDKILDVGLAIRGMGTKEVLLRAVGPTLATFGVSDDLATPVLTLFGSNSEVINSDTSWGGTTLLADTFAQVGAFALPPTSADSALLESLSTGAYSATVTGQNGATGIALAEVYDADTGTPTANLTNLSARAFVTGGTGTLVAGFVISGTTSETILVRGVGPTLGGIFGLIDALLDTKVSIYDSTGTQIYTNSGWGDDANLDAAFTLVGAFHFMAHSKDSALLVTLPPGSYTAELTAGDSGSNGLGLVEIYEVR